MFPTYKPWLDMTDADNIFFARYGVHDCLRLSLSACNGSHPGGVGRTQYNGRACREPGNGN